MEPSPDAVDRRDELVRAACREAGHRLAASTTHDSALIATGEALFWLVAADDSMLRSARSGYAAYRNEQDKDRKLLMQGLRYPRNVLAHESEAWNLGVADLYIDVYTDMYGVWTWADLAAPVPGTSESVLAQHVAYQERLTGRSVIMTTKEALGVLEDFWTSQ